MIGSSTHLTKVPALFRPASGYEHDKWREQSRTKKYYGSHFPSLFALPRASEDLGHQNDYVDRGGDVEDLQSDIPDNVKIWGVKNQP